MKIICSLLIFGIFIGLGKSTAQSWMTDYTYRKKLTIDKNMVWPTTSGSKYLDLTDFTILVELQSQDFIHTVGSCSNKIKNIEGKDISFALATSPSVPLNFQIESFDAINGKLTCWVKIPSLSAKNTSSIATSLYIYYGSSIVHNPFDVNGLNTWPASYTRIWHMNQSGSTASVKNMIAVSDTYSLKANDGTQDDIFVNTIIGKGVKLNGSGEFMRSLTEKSTAITISAWVNLNSIGTEQMIVTNDSTNLDGTNGYRLKIDATGKPVVELQKSFLANYTLSAANPLIPGRWYYLACTSTGSNLSLVVNDMLQGTKVTSFQRLGEGGTLNIGADKQGANFFDGYIDEVRIQNLARPVEFLRTEYNNQNNPAAFYSVSAEEYNPSIFSRFAGSINVNWAVAGNWSNGMVPGEHAKLIINNGKTINLSGLTPNINMLVMEPNSTLVLNGELEISCFSQVGEGAKILLSNGSKLKFGGSVVNNGSIALKETTGTVTFTGAGEVQQYRGSGTARVYKMENTQIAAAGTLTLNAPFEITGHLALNKGILNTKGNLHLLCVNGTKGASVLSVQNTDEVSVTGDVSISQLISGDYTAPATGRGWRLLSSPVYHSSIGTAPKHHLSALQKRMFITGSGGTGNGFDPSPLNGATIYTHDPMKLGTTTQRFVPILNMNEEFLIGRGCYVFCRGNREDENAYADQLVNRPFSSPSSYQIKHTGKLYIGDLKIDLQNNNAGDGFNLIGNPYASNVKWGSLVKSNLAPFIWVYDPINQSYNVSDDPDFEIPMGTGFFVKANDKNQPSSITFTEHSKSNESESGMKSSISSTDDNKTFVSLTLSRDQISQSYKLYFHNSGDDTVDEHDAVKMGEGYVSISGLVKGQQLSIDVRPPLLQKEEIHLNIKGWGTGTYRINFEGITTLDKNTFIKIFDSYTDQSSYISEQNPNYNFFIDEADTLSKRIDRFMLIFEKNSTVKKNRKNIISVFPNPFSDHLHIGFLQPGPALAKIQISNIMGQIIFRQDAPMDKGFIEIDTKTFSSGIYIIHFKNMETNETEYCKAIKK